MRIGIDYTAGVRQGGGIGRYTRELVQALLELGGLHDYTILAATGGIPSRDWRLEIENLQSLVPRLRFRDLPITDDWLHRLWQRLRLPLPVEFVTGALDIFYSPDFVLPPTLPGTRTLLTIHDLSSPIHFILSRLVARLLPSRLWLASRVYC